MRNLPAFLRPFGAAVLACLLTAPAALAAGGTGENTPLNLPASSSSAKPATPGPGGGSIVRTIVGLAVVIGVIYGLTWVLRQIKASKANTAAGAGLETLATLPLGSNKTLHLVRAGEEIVLLGAGEGGVTPIKTYTEDQARALGLLDSALPETDIVSEDNGGLIGRLRSRTVLR
jgi:flagellar protein FliO/FliZ